MKPIGSPVARRSDWTVNCAVAAYGAIEADADKIAALRQSPEPPATVTLAPNFLKHSDEQTIVGLAAVFQAIRTHDLAGEDFTDWAVLAAPRFFGRAMLANTLRRFAVEGAWGVSPHVIPHRSQHSLSGTVSQALRIHGPNLGVGGGPFSAEEAALVTATFVATEDVPGLWLVLTAWDPEVTLPDLSGGSRNGQASSTTSKCKGVALALKRASAQCAGPSLYIGAAHPASNGATNGAAPPLALFTTERLFDAFVTRPKNSSAWRLGTGGVIELKGLAETRKSS